MQTNNALIAWAFAYTFATLTPPSYGDDLKKQAFESQPAEERCANLPQRMSDAWPDASTAITSQQWLTAQTSSIAAASASAVNLPAHCDIYAALKPHVGIDDQPYRLQFHIRLPEDWNGRFFFQGGGGSNGVIGDALGYNGVGNVPALLQGYAVVSQDSGHDNAIHTDPERGGKLAFGHDPIARANYGGLSLEPVTLAAKALIRAFYGQNIKHSYFWGCSKGGQEGMMLAQRYPEHFDGIVAMAPGFSLPRASIAELWDLKAFDRISNPEGRSPVTLQSLQGAFTNDQLITVREAILASCDANDGLEDGITGDYQRCDGNAVLEKLVAQQCPSHNNSLSCLTGAHIAALATVMRGPTNSNGERLYADWAWDGGFGSENWRLWKLGSSDGKVPALNFVLGAGASAALMSVPPVPVAENPQSIGAYIERYDFDTTANNIYVSSETFPRSPWIDMGARETQLEAFERRGGKMIVPHGVSDPVFSVNDTTNWWQEVNATHNKRADAFVRVFPVPGMAHCSGGPTLDRFDTLAALVDWVERNEPPAQIIATGSSTSAWPTRTRPLCPFPKYARYSGAGNPEDSRSFECATK